MAEVKSNIITKGMSGSLGDTIVFRQKGGKTFVATTPRESTKEPSEEQKQHRIRFQEAVLYARSLDSSLKDAYEAKAKSKGANVTGYNVAVADFFNAPDISEVDLGLYHGHVNDPITVKVTDDFRVQKVSVEIYNPDGSLVEQGDAVMQADTLSWLYKATAENAETSGDKIVVKAYDTPGNISNQEQNLV